MENPTILDKTTLSLLEWVATYTPPKSGKVIGEFEQDIEIVEKTPEANILLESKFKEFDSIRINSDATDKMLPIISRLYQQLLKVALLHAISNMGYKTPVVNEKDVMFAYKVIKFYFESIKN